MPAYKYQNTAGKTMWYSSFYYKDWKGEKKRTTKRGFTTKRDALEYERAFLNSITKQPTIEFKYMIEDYLQDCDLRLKPTTMKQKRSLIKKKYLPYFGEMRICDIDVNTIRVWQNKMMEYRDKDGNAYKGTYLRNLHRELSNIMTFCMKYYGLKMNPCRLVGSMGKYDAEEMKIWTREQFEHFLECEDKKAYHVAFNVLFYSGIREGELLALTPRDLISDTYALSINKTFATIEGKDIMLTPKTDAGKRIVTLPKSVYDELAQYIKDTDCAPDQRVFYFRQPGIWHEFRRCTAVAQLPPIRIHDIRHSHVSMLVDMGFNIKQIADRMGHRNASTTMKTYSHLYAGRDIELAKRLDNKILNLTEDDGDSSEGNAGEAENAKNDC